MKYNKKVKVYRQGAISMTIPTAYCEMLNINPGDELNLSLDTETKQITIQKIEKEIIGFKELPSWIQELLVKIDPKNAECDLKFNIINENGNPYIQVVKDANN